MSSLCRRIGNLLEREVDGEVILLDTQANLVHQLNTTASFIWRKIQEGASAGEIAGMVANDFDVAHDIAQADVERLMASLKTLGIIQ